MVLVGIALIMDRSATFSLNLFSRRRDLMCTIDRKKKPRLWMLEPAGRSCVQANERRKNKVLERESLPRVRLHNFIK